jgi:ribulose 1,5-bisphosphate carboxylase large subunit-like protein
MQQQLRVDTVGVQAMAGRWGTSAGQLSETVAPIGFGLSCQPSAAAVNAAHAGVAAFTTALEARVSARAARVAEADSRYIANEAESAQELAAVADPLIGV